MSQLRNCWFPSCTRTSRHDVDPLSVSATWTAGSENHNVQRTLLRLPLPSSGPGCSPGAQASWVCRATCQTSRAAWQSAHPRLRQDSAFITAFHAIQRFCVDPGNAQLCESPASCHLYLPFLPSSTASLQLLQAARTVRFHGVALLLGKACDEKGIKQGGKGYQRDRISHIPPHYKSSLACVNSPLKPCI